jgi:hypothetical protein
VIVAIAAPVMAKDKVATPPVLDDAKRDDPRAQDERLANGVKNVVLAYVRKAGGESRDGEAIAAMAAVVGERCQEVAAEFPVRKHTFVPGQRVFSDGVNVLLAGDGRTLDLQAIPPDTVYGQIRDQVNGSRFSQERFPSLLDVFRGFAGRVGKPEDWGKVPLSVPPEEWPRLLPLRVTFDTRSGIDAALKPVKEDRARALRVCTLALTMLLNETGNDLDPSTELTLVFETINGIAKTAPMLKAIAAPTAAMRDAQHKVIKVGAR